MNKLKVYLTASILMFFAVTGVTIVASIFDQTKDQIAENERLALLSSINELVTSDQYDNDIFTDIISVSPSDLLGNSESKPVYRARKAGWPVAAILTVIAPDGYNGKIKLLVAIKLDGTLKGARVVSHQETPGLGDGIDVSRSNWILDFAEKSLTNPDEKRWKVKRDGGDFDQFSGATITPRAIVKAIKNALLYFRIHHQKLFETNAPEVESTS
ncbi:MAG: electron transport complex subunit RsxG [Gammaproteobacteria bacterium]